MRRTTILAFSIACASCLPGCDAGPKFKVSDPTSLAKMQKGMSDSRKAQLDEDMSTISSDAIFQATKSGDPSAFPKNYNQGSDGLDASEIHAKAEKIRASKGR